MVKLFVGNLAEGVDTHRLRNLFLQYVQVQECDVLKNIAFVHVTSDEDAELCIQRLHKTMLEGREIHVERSTSKLRKEPGMSDKCFTCGATDHKTPNCPQELIRRQKRGLEESELMGPGGKKPAILPTINLAGGSAPSSIQSSVSGWGCKVGGGQENDPELPCPTNPELRTLYDQYMEARTKYFFYRDRLSKELSIQSSVVQAPVHLRFDMTKGQPQMLMQQPTSAPALQYSAPPSNYPSLQYASAPQSLHSVPGSAYASRPQAYPNTTSVSQPSQLSAASSIYSNQPPTAPYNTMVRQPTSYGAYPQEPIPPSLQQPQNGHQNLQPSAPYRNSPYASHSYNTVQTGPR